MFFSAASPISQSFIFVASYGTITSFFVYLVYYFFLRSALRSAATTVLTISMVIVMGPTPPGTGVIALAFSLTASKSTSPLRSGTCLVGSVLLGFHPTRFTPTSITTAPSFTMSALMTSGEPIAATRISACLVIWAMFLVPVWTTVTVALARLFFCTSMAMRGLATLLLLL